MSEEKIVFEIAPQNRFKLPEGFLREFQGSQPKFGPVGYVVYKRTYAREKEDGTTEEFWETAQRVVEGIWSIFHQYVTQIGNPWDPQEAQAKAQEMFRRLWAFKWLPPGRGLWFMGTKALEIRGGASLQNCGFVSTQSLNRDFAEPFVTLMDFLMLGVGVGTDTRGAGKMELVLPEMDRSSRSFVVQDSREGWCALIRRILDAHVGDDTLPAHIDYSRIRKRGEPLKTFGGTASGPEPLMDLVERITTLLRRRIGHKISSTDIVDICNLIGRCVVAGNIRRSSEMVLGSHLDEEFLQLKDPTDLIALRHALETTGNTHYYKPQIDNHPLITHRWAANLSVDGSDITDFTEIAEQTVTNGEPNYVFLKNIQTRGRMSDPPDDLDEFVLGMNPCGEQPLEDGELCCLVEINPNAHDTLEDFLVTCKYAYQYAKGVTLIPTHRPQTNAVMVRNRRIGTSMMGIWEFYEKRGMQECIQWWRAGYNELRKWDKTYSHWLGVGESTRVTSVKPGGTVPLLVGVEGGMRIPNFEYGYRAVRMEEHSSIVDRCRASKYRVEKDLTTPYTSVVYFPAANPGMRTVDQVSLWEQAGLLVALQRHWSDNAVSNTLIFKGNEKNDVARVLGAYANELKSVTFLPLQDHTYEQAPYTPCSKEEYEAYCVQLLTLDLGEAQHEAEPDVFCSGEACDLRPR